MRLEVASKEAIDYACKYFHYAKKTPIATCSYSVFNDNNEWCGVIIYGRGNNKDIGTRYNLSQGQIVELLRVALNGKQEQTSKALSISLRLLKKDNPLVKLVVSYADTGQNHKGIIYQATNWYFDYISKPCAPSIYIKEKNKTIHNRNWQEKGKKKYYKDLVSSGKASYIFQKPKIKYLYPLDKQTESLCKNLAKPYIKDIANIV